MRTPLNAIIGWTQLLKDEDDEEQRHQGLTVIERNTRVQTQLVDDLLDMNRIITGKLRLEMQPVELQTVIADALNTVHPSAQLKNIQLDTHFDASIKKILGDASRLQQVIWNLLANAIKFTPNNGRLSVATHGRAEEVEIVITDSGVGIASDFLPYVFDRFRQADASISRKFGGLGLGLAIVKSLVEMHGGRVEVESEGADKGAAFRVHLPVLR